MYLRANIKAGKHLELECVGVYTGRSLLSPSRSYWVAHSSPTCPCVNVSNQIILKSRNVIECGCNAPCGHNYTPTNSSVCERSCKSEMRSKACGYFSREQRTATTRRCPQHHETQRSTDLPRQRQNEEARNKREQGETSQWQPKSGRKMKRLQPEGTSKTSFSKSGMRPRFLPNFSRPSFVASTSALEPSPNW